MRILAGLTTVAVLVAAVAFTQEGAQQAKLPAAAAVEKTLWIKVTFGLDGKNAAWDGKATATSGKIVEIKPWSFEKRDRLVPAGREWFCSTVVLPGRSQSSFAEPQRGVLLEVTREPRSVVSIGTRQGDFSVNVDELKPGTVKTFLEGRASVELLGSSRPLPERATDDARETEDDFPTLAVDRKGHRWVAWIAYEEAKLRDHLMVVDLDDPQGKPYEMPTAREQVGPQLVLDGTGVLRLFWSAPVEGNWEIHTSHKTKSGWTAPQRLTNAAGSDFHLRVACGADGSVWLAWQGFRETNSNIFAMRLKDGTWSQPLAVARNTANEWEPDVDVAPDGTAWIAYDSYQNGNYDVFLTSVAIDESGRAQQGKRHTVANSEEFEAHASVDAFDGETIWVAYDIAGPNWGRGFTKGSTDYKGRYGETLHGSRRLGLRAYRGGDVMEVAEALPQKLNRIHPRKIIHSDTEEYKRFYEIPTLARDGKGRLWLLFRRNRQGYAGHPKMGANWEFCATTFDGKKWIEPLLLPPGKGRQNQKVSTARDESGRLHLAWSTGDHHVDFPFRVRYGALPDADFEKATPGLKKVALAKSAPDDRGDDRGWEVVRDGERLQVHFGDLHRHTDISLCYPTADGCLVDAYRYALDAARLDFLAVTDHTRDTDPLPWWRSQKANDLFYVPGTFAPIYAYERSNSAAGGGHRNVFFLERDWPVLRSDAHYSYTGEKRPENNNPDVALYPHLRGKNALTIAHTPAYNARAERGTWTYHDPQVEPLAEMIQTFRRDYERPGPAQWPNTRDQSQLREEASLWYALARGYRLGFIASSDHHATHTAFAGVWARDATREAIFTGLRSRHTFAATDRIFLEVRMGEALMGDRIQAPETPTLTIRAQGTAPIVEVQVVKNRKVVHSVSPGERAVRLTFADQEYAGGAAYYYVRLRQEDGSMAWGSPIWVR